MKNIILISALTMFLFGHSLQDYQKKEIVSIDAISIIYDNQKLYIDIKNNNPIHFQIWKNNELILNAKGNTGGIESFPVSKGNYKLMIFNEQGKPKTKFFHI